MLKREDLEKFKSVTGLNIWQIERDYLQHLFLLFLSRYVKDELVFKGGTALQKAYALNRFSIDLDFTLNDANFDSQTLFKKLFQTSTVLV
jgi:predicted nucleotidyltransferase component of viral defense system